MKQQQNKTETIQMHFLWSLFSISTERTKKKYIQVKSKMIWYYYEMRVFWLAMFMF